MNNIMILISHRGNLNGPDPKNENSVKYIEKAINEGFEVEIDVYFSNGSFYLGHDYGKEEVKLEWFYKKPLWCHAKNYDAFKNLLTNNLHCFWHDQDKFTLTSKGFIWAYPGIQGNHKTIAVKPENYKLKLNDFCGICSDWITSY